MTSVPISRESRKAVSVFLLLGIAVLGFGCGTAPVNSYYTLENVAPKKAKATAPACNAVLAVESVAVDPPYDLTKVVFRPDDLEVRYYTHRHWVCSPEEMMRKLLIRRLDAEEIFAEVDSIVFLAEPDLTLFAKVHNLEEIDKDKKWNGRLAMSFSVRDDISGNEVWEYRFDETKPASQNDIKSMILTLNDIYNSQMKKMIQSLKMFLAGYRRCSERRATEVEPD